MAKKNKEKEDEGHIVFGKGKGLINYQNFTSLNI